VSLSAPELLLEELHRSYSLGLHGSRDGAHLLVERKSKVISLARRLRVLCRAV
jgi:hypothetical protein